MDRSTCTNYKWYHHHHHPQFPQLFFDGGRVLWQGFSFGFLLCLICGLLGRKSPQFGKLFFLFFIILFYFIFVNYYWIWSSDREWFAGTEKSTIRQVLFYYYYYYFILFFILLLFILFYFIFVNYYWIWSFNREWSAGTEKSTIRQVVSFFILFINFFFLSIITGSGCLTGSGLYLKIPENLCILFSKTASGLCIYHFVVWSTFSLLHNSTVDYLHTKSCQILYYFCAILWLNVSSLLLDNLQLLCCCVLSILALTLLVLMALFYATIRSSVPFLRFPSIAM